MIRKLIAIVSMVVAFVSITPAANAALSNTPLNVGTTNGNVDATTVLYLDVPYYAFVGNFTQFKTVDGVSHTAKNLAVVNSINKKLVFAGDLNGYAYSVLGFNSVMYVGGKFTTADGISRFHAVAYSTNNWAMTNWKPTVTGSTVNALAHNGVDVLVSDSKSVQATNYQTGARKWIQSVDSGGPIRALLAQHASGYLYVGGLFDKLGGFTQHAIVALNMNTGAVITSFKVTSLRLNSYIGPSGGWDGENDLSFGFDGSYNRLVAGIGGHGANWLITFDAISGKELVRHQTVGDVQAVVVFTLLNGRVIYFAGFHRSMMTPGQVFPFPSEYFATMWYADNGLIVPWDGGFTGPNTLNNDDNGNGGVQAASFDLLAGILITGGAMQKPNESINVYSMWG